MAADSTSPFSRSDDPDRDDLARDELERDDLDRFENDAANEDHQAIEDRLEGLLSLEPAPDARPGRGRPTGPKLAPVEQRAKGPDRRKNVVDTRPSGLERRRGPGRRLPDFIKAAEEGEMNAEQFLFLKAIETFKTVNGKHYPNWTDVLEVVRLLGYRKVQANELNLPGVEDWHERADAASNVRAREGVTHKRRKAG